jgi:glycosyltransferase involved in cell wall biosynthesis
MHKSPLVSVVMSVYNGQDCVKNAIDSILNQSLRDFEFIIVNDGSTDDSLTILKSFKDDRIIVIDQENIGLTKSLNKALGRVTSKYVARIDADDTSYKERLQLQYDYMENNQSVVVLGTKGLIIGKNGHIVSDFYTKDQIKKVINYKNPLIHSSVMIRYDEFKKIGFYNEHFKTTQDYEAWVRMIDLGNIEMIDKVLIERNMSSNTVSRKNPFFQSYNSFKIKSRKINIFHNLGLLFYQLSNNLLGETGIFFLKKYIPKYIITMIKRTLFKQKF